MSKSYATGGDADPTIRVWIRSGKLPAKVEAPRSGHARLVIAKKDYWRFVEEHRG